MLPWCSEPRCQERRWHRSSVGRLFQRSCFHSCTRSGRSSQVQEAALLGSLFRSFVTGPSHVGPSTSTESRARAVHTALAGLGESRYAIGTDGPATHSEPLPMSHSITRKQATCPRAICLAPKGTSCSQVASGGRRSQTRPTVWVRRRYRTQRLGGCSCWTLIRRRPRRLPDAHWRILRAHRYGRSGAVASTASFGPGTSCRAWTRRGRPVVRRR